MFCVLDNDKVNFFQFFQQKTQNYLCIALLLINSIITYFKNQFVFTGGKGYFIFQMNPIDRNSNFDLQIGQRTTLFEVYVSRRIKRYEIRRI